MTSTSINNEITIEEVSLFSLIIVIVILLGIILFYYIWVKNYGVMIPNPQLLNEENIIFFNTKNYAIAINELWKRIKGFDKKYLLRSIGVESYIYLIFQRKIISLILTMSIFSFLFSFISNYVLNEEVYTKGSKSHFQDFLLNNRYLNDITTTIHLISVILFTFLHFRFFTKIKNEAKYIYFERFDKMSRKKDADWLSCRTLHISGLAPNERNTSVLKRKIDLYLFEQEGGKVVDIKFIPDYKYLLELEREKNEILDIRDLINNKESSLARRWFFPKIYKTESSIQYELDRIEFQIQRATELPVYSSGHAFVCLDSLESAYKCLNAFKEGTWRKLHLQIKSLWDDFNKRAKVKSMQTSTFQKFEDEDLEVAMMDHKKVNLLVDQMIEPFDIIWLNVGGDRGVNIFRRIVCNFFIILVLFFLTTPTSMFSALKSMDYFSLLEFTWIIKIPYGYIIKTYLPPLIILLLNLFLIYLIDLLSIFEKNYTHSRFQYSVFTKSFFYMMLNFLVIPGITLTTADSLFSIVYEKIYNMPELLSKIYLSNSGYFFITLLIQNGTLSSVFYLLRLDEIFLNSLSPFITFYKRYFINSSKQWHRTEGDAFQFGYFYAQFLTFYTIALVFSTVVPFICPACLYFFLFRHIVDYISLLTVHRSEIDSSGNLINSILNFSFIPVSFYHICMMSFFLVKSKFTAAIITSVIFLLSLIYTCYFNSKYIFDAYSLHEKLSSYDLPDEKITFESINKWRNKYRHPLVIPIDVSSSPSESENENNKKKKVMKEIQKLNTANANANAINRKNFNDFYNLENSINSLSNLTIRSEIEQHQQRKQLQQEFNKNSATISQKNNLLDEE